MIFNAGAAKVALAALIASLLSFTPTLAQAETYPQAIDRLIKERAADERQWLRLGHWQKRSPLARLVRSRYLSEADGSALFISPSGATDPEAELRATLEAFALPLSGAPFNGDEAKHPQCMFPARRRWAENKLGWRKLAEANAIPVLPCKDRAAWKQKLDAEGVSLVFASAYLNNAASMFGHTFLKFHSRGNRDGKDLLDYGVNFAAETGTDGGVPFAVLGLTGHYKGYFSMQPFHQTLREYANLEGRDLWEYRLNLSAEELDFFIDHLFELERTYFDYYFLSENCSYFLIAALETAKPSLELTAEFWYHVIPADSVRVVARSPGFVTAEKYRPSLATIFNWQKRDANGSELEFARTVIDEGAPIALHNPALDRQRALDLAIDYGAMKAARDPKKFDPINYSLRVTRASIGGSSGDGVRASLPVPARPEQGHDPGRIGLVVEVPTENSTVRDARFGFQQRFAYHDRLSNDDGYLKGTTLEVLRTTGLYDGNANDREFRIREVAVLEILSTQPRDRFAKPLSWRASFGVREPVFAKTLGPYVNGGIGFTFGHDWGWLTALVDGEALSNGTLEQQPTPAWVGPRLIATGFLSRSFRLGVDGKLYRSINGARSIDTVAAEAAWSATRNFEIRIGYGYFSQEGQERNAWTAKVYQHILF